MAHVSLESFSQTWQNWAAKPETPMKFVFTVCIVVAVAFSGCNLFKKREKDAAKKPEQTMRDQSSDADFQAFVGRLRKVVRAHDINTLATMMTKDFGYRLNPEASGDGVFKYWDESGLWLELEGILSERFVPKGNYMVAPPQFADENLNYDGYRAGIRREGGSWKFAYFVNG